jgi:hypothetical protein
MSDAADTANVIVHPPVASVLAVLAALASIRAILWNSL